jgi:galactose-1-phosphate uridylyltransferase
MRAREVPDGGPLTRLPDGTVKQVNPLTGTEVWTVPGRAQRPWQVAAPEPGPVDPARAGRYCAFCPGSYLRTPPEKARLVRSDGGWRLLEHLPAERLAEPAEFRLVANLFAILSYDYWRTNHGYTAPAPALAHKRAYLATPAGRAHVLGVVHERLRAGGLTEDRWAAMTEAERLAPATGFFASGHDVVIARRHYVDGAATDDQLAGSGTLSPEEHRHFLRFTAEAARRLYAANPLARYVAVFQNWLRPSGASFDHLHKQLVAIDEHGRQTDRELAQLATNADLFNDAAVNPAAAAGLVVAENDHAVAFAGFGHRYPTLEVYSKSARSLPWEHDDAELGAVSDLLHACHAATGTAVPTNEEWHHRPADVAAPMPWRIMLKWRVSTIAGFEGGTKIYLNTLDPWALRDQVVPRLLALRTEGRIAAMDVGTECAARPDCLRYAG